jgi:hypothetical protein
MMMMMMMMMMTMVLFGQQRSGDGRGWPMSYGCGCE